MGEVDKKIVIISGKTEYDLRDKIIKYEKEKEVNFFATTPIQKNDNSWVMFCYYNEDRIENEKPFKPISKKQTRTMKKYKINIPLNCSSSQASKLIEASINKK